MDAITAATLAGSKSSGEVEKRKPAKQAKRSGQQTFSQTLNKAGSLDEDSPLPSVDDKALGQLLDEVFSLGEKLKKDHALHCLASYRKSVKKLLDYALAVAYRHEEVKGVINRHTMTQKRHSVVRIIDTKLDQLAQSVIAEQRTIFNILGKVNEINGLLINLWR